MLAPLALVVALGVALVACGPSVAVDDGDSTGGADAGENTTVGDGPNTTMPTTSPGTTVSTTVTTTMSDSSSDTLEATTEGDDVDDEGGAFYGGPPDGGGPGIECNVWAQDCQEGDKCMPWNNDGSHGWNATKCSPLDPNGGAPGDPCTVEGGPFSGIDSCALGSMCWDVDPATNQGTCAANCEGSEANPQCPNDPSAQCLLGYDGTIHVCVPTCDPRLQDCVATSTCVPVDDVFFCVPDGSARAGLYGDGCTAFDECDPGLFCATSAAVPECDEIACCTEFCEVDFPDPDTQCSGVDQGVQCVPWFEDGQAPPGWETLGACVIPN